MKRKLKDGFSNNPNYVGDWFGKGQIDFNAIINPEDVGDVWMIKLWCGSGYQLDVYLCKANNVYEAMDVVFKWSYENEGANNMVFDYDYIMSECEENFKKYPDYFGDDLSDDFDEFEMRWFDEYVSSENELYARSENFFAKEVPAEVLAENGYNEVNDSCKVKDSEDEYHGTVLQLFIAFKGDEQDEEEGCRMCEEHDYERGEANGVAYEFESEFDCVDGIAQTTVYLDIDESTLEYKGFNAYDTNVNKTLIEIFKQWGIYDMVQDFEYDIDEYEEYGA